MKSRRFDEAHAREFVLAAIIGTMAAPRRLQPIEQPREPNGDAMYAVTAGLKAYDVFLARTDEPRGVRPAWKSDPKARAAVEYLLDIGFNADDFLRADADEGHGD